MRQSAFQFATSEIASPVYNSIKQSQITLSSRSPNRGAVLQHRETPETFLQGVFIFLNLPTDLENAIVSTHATLPATDIM